MSRENGVLGKIIFGFLVFLMVITVLLTLLGGAGTICAAFNPEDYEAMKSLIPYKNIYKIFVAGSIAIGIWGAIAVVKLIGKRRGIYRTTLTVLILGVVFSGAQTILSETVRGTSVPGNFRFYVNAFTLLVFLLFLIPGMKNVVSFEKDSADKPSGGVISGISLLTCAMLMLSMKLWTGISHIPSGGENWIDIASFPIRITSLIMIFAGLRLIFNPLYRKFLKLFGECSGFQIFSKKT